MIFGFCGNATAQPGVRPGYERFFRYYKAGRSLPSAVLQAHGINDDQVGRSYAIIAGVSTYPNLPADKRNLLPAKHDIDNMVAFLRDKQFFDEIIVLEDGDVNLDNFNYFMQVYLPQQMGNQQNARFLFAYSGHGFDDQDGSSYILTNTATSLSDISSGIDLFQLKIVIGKVVSKALNSIVLINSCQGGSFLSRVPFGPNRLLLASFGAHAITAGAKGQLTYGSGAGNSGSYFFDEVIQALSGGADFDGGGLITVDQLYSFVRTHVQDDTNDDQDPQFGDIAPHSSRGSFFFVDPRPVPAAAAVHVLIGHQGSDSFGNSPKTSCAFALFSDYYEYSLANNLQDDLLRLVDTDTWQALKALPKDGSSPFFSAGRTFLGGSYPLDDDYTLFDQKRSTHYRDAFYDRSIQQAADIMQLTMGDRNYKAYGNCIGSQSSGSAIKAWASRESINNIEFHIRNDGTAAAEAIDVRGSVIGGVVIGAPQGSLFQAPLHLAPREERVITIQRATDLNQVNVELSQIDGSDPLNLTYRRADGVLSAKLTGPSEVLREANHRVEIHTPNNSENRGSCPNEVGHHDGKYCTSRTTLTVSTAEHSFLRNARVECSGAGCPWTQVGQPVFNADHSSVSASLDNWGLDVQAVLIVDEYEQLSPKECGTVESIPAVYNRPVLLAVAKACVPFTAVKWVKLPSLEEGMVSFGSQSASGPVIMNSSPIQGDSAVIASYSLTTSAHIAVQPDPRDPKSLTAGALEYQSLYDGARTDELALANLGEAAFRRGDYNWTIKYLEQAHAVQHSKVWMGRYPYLAVSYLLAKDDKAKFEQTLQDMLQAMSVPNTFLYHAYPRSAIVTELKALLAVVPVTEQGFLNGVIQSASALTTN